MSQKPPPHKQIIKDILRITKERGWRFKIDSVKPVHVDHQDESGKVKPGKKHVVCATCESGQKLEIHIDHFIDGKIRFKGIDPFKDIGPFPTLLTNAMEKQEENKNKINLDDLTQEQKDKLKALIDAQDRDGVIAYLQELGKLPEVLPPPSIPSDTKPSAFGLVPSMAALADGDRDGALVAGCLDGLEGDLPSEQEVIGMLTDAAKEIKAGVDVEEATANARRLWQARVAEK